MNDNAEWGKEEKYEPYNELYRRISVNQMPKVQAPKSKRSFGMKKNFGFTDSDEDVDQKILETDPGLRSYSTKVSNTRENLRNRDKGNYESIDQNFMIS